MRITQIEDGVHFVQGPMANWTILEDGAECVLIDSGYPSDVARVRASIRAVLGHDVVPAEIYITHGHTDHVGGAAYFHRVYGVPVFAHSMELPSLRREELHQIAFRDVRAELWRPRVFAWVTRAVLAGGLRDVVVRRPIAAPTHDFVVSTGHALSAAHLPGHTSGSVIYRLSRGRILVAGDTLVTAHPLSALKGVQSLPDLFHSHPAQALSALESLLAMTIHGGSFVLPGHGPLVLLGERNGR